MYRKYYYDANDNLHNLWGPALTENDTKYRVHGKPMANLDVAFTKCDAGNRSQNRVRQREPERIG